jgi:hypothetical protein
MSMVDIHIENTDIGYDDWSYTNVSGIGKVLNMYEGNIKITLSKLGYDTLVFTSLLSENSNYNLEMNPKTSLYYIGVFLFDDITNGIISNAKVNLYLKDNATYYMAYSRNSNMFGYTRFDGGFAQNTDYFISVNHSQYPFYSSLNYTLPNDNAEHVFYLNSIYHTYTVNCWIWNTTGGMVHNANIVVYQDENKIREEQLIANSIIFNLKSSEKYSITVSHEDYHSKTLSIQNLDKIERLDFNLTLSSEINPENPFGLDSYGWLDFFKLISVIGLPIFVLLLILFVYRAFDSKDKEYEGYRKY